MTDKKASSTDRSALQNAFYWLCSYRGDNNFFGRLLNSCRRNYKTEMESAAGVRIDTNGRYHLDVNLERFNSYPVPLQLCVLVHEAAHLGLRHFERMVRIMGGRLNSHDFKLQEIWKVLNIAADLTVNDIAVRPIALGKKKEAFAGVFEHLLFPEKFDLPLGLSMEEYFLKLMENDDLRNDILEKIGQKVYEVSFDIFGDGDGDGDGDSNDEEGGAGSGQAQRVVLRMKGMSGAEVERLANDLQRNAATAVRNAIEQTKRCNGTIPGCMDNIIEELLTEPKVPWPILLRNQIKSVLSNKLIHSIIQPNISLFPVIDDGIEPYPGYNNDFTFRITCATDTSGSVGDNEFSIFMNEITSIMRQFQGIELRHILFDHGIQFEKSFTRTSTDAEIDEISKELRVRHGYGGTEFCAPFRRVLGEDLDRDWAIAKPDAPLTPTDLFVIFTDGCAPVSDDHGGPMPSLKPPCSTIWVICKGGQTDPAMLDFVVKIED